MDHSKTPNEAEWSTLLDELDDHVKQLRKHSVKARLRAKQKVKDGFPPGHSPDGGSGGGSGDPTASYVIQLAGGQGVGEDTWKPPYDPIGNAVRNMIREATDARNRLRGATASMQKALPVSIPDEPREVCVTCGVSKRVAGRWVQAEGRCQACSVRIARQGTQPKIAITT